MIKLKDILNEVITEDENESNADFLKWFGNSKVVGNSGKPLEVYHGSQTEIGNFHDGDKK